MSGEGPRHFFMDWTMDWVWYDEIVNDDIVYSQNLLDLEDFGEDQNKCQQFALELLDVFTEPNHGSPNTQTATFDRRQGHVQ